MNSLNANGISEIIRRRVTKEGVPILGICLGMQLLADKSFEHGQHAGLRLLPGQVNRLVSESRDDRIPNIGWNKTIPAKESVLFDKLDCSNSFYFVHSYYFSRWFIQRCSRNYQI